LGRHEKPSRIRFTYLLPGAAVPALAATAAAVCMAPQSLADPPAAHVAAKPSAIANTASSADQSLAELLFVQKAAEQTAAPAQPTRYTVRPGDSLSAIAGRVYHKQAAWPVLYWANRGKIRSASSISVGQVLNVPAEPASIPAAPGQLGPVAAAAAPASVTEAPLTEAPAASAPAYVPAAAAPAAASSYSGGVPGGSFGQCVLARESGGDAQAMNSSGHYGLYQFSEATWVAYGGSAADFGDASVGEQNQVFANALAQGGQSNWSAYDGC